jgi:hypothetical protein
MGLGSMMYHDAIRTAVRERGRRKALRQPERDGRTAERSIRDRREIAEYRAQRAARPDNPAREARIMLAVMVIVVAIGVLALAGCSSAAPAVSDPYADGNSQVCTAYAGGENDVEVQNVSQENNPDPALAALVTTWANAQDTFSGTQDDPSTQNGKQANRDQQALKVAGSAVGGWCQSHGYAYP